MKLENLRVRKLTNSGSDFDWLRRNLWVNALGGGGVKLHITLPTGNGSSHFTIELPREIAKELQRCIEDVREAAMRGAIARLEEAKEEAA